MTQKLDAGTTTLLRTLLDDAEPLLPFAEAVVLHLTSPPARSDSPEGIVGSVVALLRAASDPDDTAAVNLLCEDPRLLASFFQNADLLDPGSPEAAGVARLVMTALERVDGTV
jgi:hypothetical protein